MLPIRVISLENSERRSSFTLCERDFNYYSAVTCNESLDFREDLFRLVYGRECRLGEIGCSLSHHYLAREHTASDSEWLCVLEDDAIVKPHFYKLLDNIDNTNFSEPTIILLGHSKTREQDVFIQRLKQPINNKIKIGEFEFGYSRVNFCGTVGYLINRAAAEIISGRKEIFWLADDFNIISNMGIKVLHPRIPLVYENLDFESSTGNEITYYHSIKEHFIHNLYVIFKVQIKRVLKIR